MSQFRVFKIYLWGLTAGTSANISLTLQLTSEQLWPVEQNDIFYTYRQNTASQTAQQSRIIAIFIAFCSKLVFILTRTRPSLISVCYWFTVYQSKISRTPIGSFTVTSNNIITLYPAQKKMLRKFLIRCDFYIKILITCIFSNIRNGCLG